jgi:hypothetical protein
VQHVEEILISGLLREYVRREEVYSFPRGRVEIHRGIQTLYPRGIMGGRRGTAHLLAPRNRYCRTRRIWLKIDPFALVGKQRSPHDASEGDRAADS